MRISIVIIAVMFAISLAFTIVGLVTFDLSVQEITKILGSRNEGFAFNMMQGLDKHIEKRILDFQKLTNLNVIQSELIKSNEEFKNIEDLETFLNLKEQEIKSQKTPFLGTAVDDVLTKELENIIKFYKDEYNYDVVKELFVTNAYGANVALATGTSDYSQSDEDWWKETKEKGIYEGKVQYNQDYESYSIDFAFRVNDVDGNFIGVLRVVITLDDILRDFAAESNLLTTSGRNAILLDEDGHSIYSNEEIKIEDSPISYYPTITNGPDSGYFELEDSVDDFRLVSYSQSSGYKTFEGLGWVTVIEQNKSSIVAEFVDLRNSILLASISGMIASVVGGFLISTAVSSPLKNLAAIAKTISQGKFKVSIKKSKINEIQSIGTSIEEMANNLEKLVETEKQLAEAHVKIKDERLSAIGELAASMAHNMKNPLATIRTSAQILQKNTTKDNDLDEVVNRMNRSIDRLSHQIDDVLNFVRVTPLEIKSIAVSNLLWLALKSVKIPDNISVLIPDSEIKIKCDVRKLEIVFINLFLNSIQSIGEAQGTIKCKIEKLDSMALIEIEDSGPGIPDDILPKLFHPLVTSKQSGTGLGLSTCKNVIEQHKGTISAQNNPTRFIIHLPSE